MGSSGSRALFSQDGDAVVDAVLESPGSCLVLCGVDGVGGRFAVELRAEPEGCSVSCELASVTRCPTAHDVPCDVQWTGVCGRESASPPDSACLWWRGRPAAKALRRLLPFRTHCAHVSDGAAAPSANTLAVPRDAWRGGGGSVVLCLEPLMIRPSCGIGLAKVEAPAEVDAGACSARVAALAKELQTAVASPAPQYLNELRCADLPAEMSGIVALLFATPPDDSPDVAGRVTLRKVTQLPLAPAPTPLAPAVTVRVPHHLQMRGVTFYGIRVSSGEEEQWTVWRRYNNFCRLKEVLTGQCSGLPPLPPKSAGKLSAKAVEVRRQGLEAFLQGALQSAPDAAGSVSRALCSFLAATHRGLTLGDGLTTIVTREQATDRVGLNYTADAIITNTREGGPAHQAGLDPGLCLVKVDGKNIHSDLDAKAAFAAAGTEFPVVVRGWWSHQRRKGGSLGASDGVCWSDASVRSLLKDRSATSDGTLSQRSEKRVSFSDGELDVKEYTPPSSEDHKCLALPVPAAYPSEFNVSRQPGEKVGVNYVGCVITRVQDGGPAAAAGLEPGMRILAIAGFPVDRDEEARDAFLAAGPDFTVIAVDGILPAAAAVLESGRAPPNVSAMSGASDQQPLREGGAFVAMVPVAELSALDRGHLPSGAVPIAVVPGSPPNKPEPAPAPPAVPEPPRRLPGHIAAAMRRQQAHHATTAAPAPAAAPAAAPDALAGHQRLPGHIAARLRAGRK
eukprot:TRINITY_DN7580_c0_g1_i1.p1 TRINITY_DN7580_c0_g1~~TRINITY_DN7580_c0_g1_i1.p1  ORF type:complete len:734 (+),score=207.87 TRINITY_DN7580_c0_g1_i1:56-2257(+)